MEEIRRQKHVEQGEIRARVVRGNTNANSTSKFVGGKGKFTYRILVRFAEQSGQGLFGSDRGGWAKGEIEVNPRPLDCLQVRWLDL